MTVLTIGEAMVELRARDGGFAADVAGDAFNTASHLAALGHDVVHAQDLADDVFGSLFSAAFAARGVRRLGRLLPDRTNGIYVVTVDATGERHFQYHRAGSAAGETLAGDLGALRSAAARARLIYLTGITLATSAAPDALLDLLAQSPAPIAIGLNFRRGLHRRQGSALVAMPAADVARLLHGAIAHAAVVFGSREEFTLLGCAASSISGAAPDAPIAVVTAGADGAAAFGAGTEVRWLPPATVDVVDSAGAGDALAAGFLEAWLSGCDLAGCLAAGGRRGVLAVGHPGALPAINPAVRA